MQGCVYPIIPKEPVQDNASPSKQLMLLWLMENTWDKDQSPAEPVHIYTGEQASYM